MAIAGKLGSHRFSVRRRCCAGLKSRVGASLLAKAVVRVRRSLLTVSRLAPPVCVYR